MSRRSCLLLSRVPCWRSSRPSCHPDLLFLLSDPVFAGKPTQNNALLRTVDAFPVLRLAASDVNITVSERARVYWHLYAFVTVSVALSVDMHRRTNCSSALSLRVLLARLSRCSCGLRCFSLWLLALGMLAHFQFSRAQFNSKLQTVTGFNVLRTVSASTSFASYVAWIWLALSGYRLELQSLPSPRRVSSCGGLFVLAAFDRRPRWCLAASLFSADLLCGLIGPRRLAARCALRTTVSSRRSRSSTPWYR